MSELGRFPWDEDLVVLSEATEDLLKRLWALGFREAAFGLLESNFDVPFSAAADYALTRAGWLVEQSDGVTRERIQAVIAQTLGPTFSDPAVSTVNLAAAIAGAFTDMAGWRAQMIARTETAYAAAYGQVAAFKAGEIEEVLISDGDDWDEPCIEADGSTWTLAEYEGNPLEHPNCTRAASPIVPEPETLAAVAMPPSEDSLVDIEIRDLLKASIERQDRMLPELASSLAEIVRSQPVPQIHVDVQPSPPAQVTFAPEIHVDVPPALEPVLAKRSTVRTVERDDVGRITRVIEESD